MVGTEDTLNYYQLLSVVTMGASSPADRGECYDQQELPHFKALTLLVRPPASLALSVKQDGDSFEVPVVTSGLQTSHSHPWDKTHAMVLQGVLKNLVCLAETPTTFILQ